jgi:thiamine biosynthesis lipoprotein
LTFKKIFVIHLIIISFFSCTQYVSSKSEFALGTVCSITLYERGRENVYRNIFTRLREIENLMSVNISASDVSRINAAAGITPVQVNEEVFKVIERAVYYAEISGGAFDPTVGPLVSLWGIGGDNPRVPSHEEIEQALSLINWKGVVLDTNTHSVFLPRGGMALDLGAIAKGYAADAAADIIKKAGVKRAIIDLGGNVLICGQRKDSRPWRVGVQNPNESRGDYVGVLQITADDGKQSVVTSGVYERFFDVEDKRYHHIFSPSQGYPANNGLSSVTVITPFSIDADALSTSVFVLGYEKGRKFIESLPSTEAVFIFEDSSVHITPGADFTLTDNSFQLEPQEAMKE